MTMNRLHNCINPYQGNARKVLCVCSAGLLRSPSAVVLQKEYGYNTRAAGLDADHALIPLDNVLLTWADEIVCMDESQAKKIFKMLEEHSLNREIVVLEVPDTYGYMDHKLQELILTRYKESLN